MKYLYFADLLLMILWNHFAMNSIFTVLNILIERNLQSMKLNLELMEILEFKYAIP